MAPDIKDDGVGVREGHVNLRMLGRIWNRDHCGEGKSGA